MNEEIFIKNFILNYYKLIDFDNLKEFYSNSSKITRMKGSEINTFLLSENPFKDLNPFEKKLSNPKINSNNYLIIKDTIILNVYGSFLENNKDLYFSQEFTFQQINLNWKIINDVFFGFFELTIPIWGAELLTESKQNEILFNNNNHNQYQPRIISKYKNQIENFDLNRTITLLDLPQNYDGDYITNILNNYFIITKKYYTKGMIFYEFNSLEQKNDFINNPPLIPDINYNIENGIITIKK